MEEKEYWLKRMSDCNTGDIELDHVNADVILCELVEKYCPFGKDVVEEFSMVDKWYA